MNGALSACTCALTLFGEPIMTMTRFAIVGFVVAAGTLPAHAQTPSAGVREVASSERRLIPLSTKLRYTTMIILPDDEEIVDVVCGDKEFWVINAAHNIAHLKPAKEGAATNLNLVTASGAVYSFLLTENGKAPADLKVHVTPDPDATPKTTKYYTAKEVADMQAALTDLRASVQSVARQSESSVADFRSHYPTSLEFSYSVPAYGKPFFVKAIWHDDKNTYIKADPQELPSLYEVAGGKPALVNFQVDNGTYIVPKVLERGYLAIGKDKLEFREKGR
jgi:type IV secretion system protein VirB9